MRRKTAHEAYVLRQTTLTESSSAVHFTNFYFLLSFSRLSRTMPLLSLSLSPRCTVKIKERGCGKNFGFYLSIKPKYCVVDMKEEVIYNADDGLLTVYLFILENDYSQLNFKEKVPDPLLFHNPKTRSLEELDASFNNLTYLPTNIGYGLVNLRRLSIHLNKIRSLPTSICEMSSLRYLDVHFNELRGLPHAIGKLTNLEVLNLSSNFSDLTELPETFGDLINLRELDLSNNQIRALPITFGRLENLTKLNLDQNPLVIPPMDIVSKGAEAVKEFMAKWLMDIIAEEEQRSMVEANKQAQSQTGWLAWGTSLLNNAVSGVSESVAGYLGGRKASKDPYLDQQL